MSENSISSIFSTKFSGTHPTLEASKSKDVLSNIHFQDIDISDNDIEEVYDDNDDLPVDTSQKTKSHDFLPKHYFEYTAKEGDTIESIAEQFSISPSLICSPNKSNSDKINPGDVLKIFDFSEIATDGPIQPIDVYLFEDFNPKISQNFKGKLMIRDHNLIFKPNLKNESPVCINLLNLHDVELMPHPDLQLMGVLEKTDTDPFNLFVRYFISLDDKDEIEVICFKGKKRDLEIYQNEILRVSNDIKQNLKQKSSSCKKSSKSSKSKDRFKNFAAKFKKNFYNPPSVLFPQSQKNDENSFSTTPPHPVSNSNCHKRKFEVLPIKLINRNSDFITMEDVDKIRIHFPHRYTNKNWTCIYKLSEDGASYTLFFKKAGNYSPLVLLIKTSDNEIIGSYLSTPFLPSSEDYYGTGSNFVFTFYPTFKHYDWSTNNTLFVSTSKEFIAIGGGGGAAIWIDDQLLEAFSEPCKTFNSPILTSKTHFEIRDIELWHIGEF